MKKLVIVALAVLAMGVWFLLTRETPVEVQPVVKDDKGVREIYQFDTTKCPAGETDFEMADVYMRGIVNKGQKVRAQLNWYSCHQPERGDVVLYRFSNRHDPVVKRIVGLPGDKFKVEWNTEQKSWNLVINGERLMDTEKKARPYFFGAEAKPPLKLYEEAHSGELAPNHVIVLSAFPPGDRDSAMFGALSITDIVAKVEARSTGQDH